MTENQTAVKDSNPAETNQGKVALQFWADGSNKTWLHKGPNGIPKSVPTTMESPKICPWSSLGARLEIKAPKQGERTPKATPKLPTPKAQKSGAAQCGKTPPSPQSAHERDMVKSAVACTTYKPPPLINGALKAEPESKARNQNALQREASACSIPMNDWRYMVDSPQAPFTAKVTVAQMMRYCPKKRSLNRTQ